MCLLRAPTNKAVLFEIGRSETGYSTATTPRGRSAAPKIYHDILYSTATTPRLSAALFGEQGGVAERSAFGGLASSKVGLLKILRF